MKIIQASDIAALAGKSESQIRRTLSQCEEAGLAERIGQRGGWRLTPAGIAIVTPATVENTNPPASPSIPSGGGVGIGAAREPGTEGAGDGL